MSISRGEGLVSDVGQHNSIIWEENNGSANHEISWSIVSQSG